jgi:glycosyl transferase family 25
LKTYVVSLLDQKKRRRLVVDEVKKYNLEFEFFEAVDGKQLGQDVLDAHFDAPRNEKYFKRTLSMGEIACYLSHLELWKRVAQGDDDYALILEDDFEFLSDPTPFLCQLADKNITDVMIKIDGTPKRQKLRIVEQLNNTALVLTDVIPARTTGYLIGRNAAKALYKSRKTFFRTIDNDIKHHWEFDVPVLVAIPQLVHERDDNSSGLDASRKAHRSGGAFRRFFRNVAYQVRFKMGLLLHPKPKAVKI